MFTEIAYNVTSFRDDVASVKKRLEHVESHPPSYPVPPSIKTRQSKSPNPTRIIKKKTAVCSRCESVGHAKQKCIARFHVKSFKREDTGVRGREQGSDSQKNNMWIHSRLSLLL